MIGALACSGQLALTLLAASRATHNPTAAALARLCAGMFGWMFAALMHDLTLMHAFHVLDVSISPLVPALALDFVARFVQRARSLRNVIRVAYAGALVLSVMSALSPFWALAAAIESSAWWGVAFFVVGYPALGVSAVLLRRDLKLRGTPDERWRTHLLLSALLVGTSLGLTELLGKSGFETLRLGSLGALLSGVLMSIGALRFRLLDRNPSLAIGGYVFGAAVLVLAAFSTAVDALRSQPPLLALAACGVTAAVGWFVARLTRLLDVERERAEQLVFLGRAADQMAHDLRNPIAALKGSLQFLLQERRLGRSLDTQEAMLELAAEQVHRLERLVVHYRRLGRIDPEFTRVDLEALIRSVVMSQRQAGATDAQLQITLDGELPHCDADPDMLSATLDNVVRNAIEALGDHGKVEVHAKCSGDVVSLVVTDTGPGMQPDVAARAFEAFYTTKAGGSGLGLAFVRRVMEAHGGRVSLESEAGKGTRVELTLPVIQGVEHD